MGVNRIGMEKSDGTRSTGSHNSADFFVLSLSDNSGHTPARPKSTHRPNDREFHRAPPSDATPQNSVRTQVYLSRPRGMTVSHLDLLEETWVLHDRLEHSAMNKREVPIDVSSIVQVEPNDVIYERHGTCDLHGRYLRGGILPGFLLCEALCQAAANSI